MTQPAKSQEPSMEEILASIRRHIADEAPARGSAPNEALGGEPRRSAAPPIQPHARGAVSGNSAPAMLDEEISAKLAELRGMSQQTPSASAEASEPSSQAGPGGPTSERPASERLLATATIADIQTAQPRSDRTVEELVSDLMRPMLKSWLEDNLPALIERLVGASRLLVAATDADRMAEQWGRDVAITRLAYMKRHLERNREAEIERASPASAEQEDRLAPTTYETAPEPTRELSPQQEAELWRATMKAKDLLRDFDEFCAQVNKLDAEYTVEKAADIEDYQLALAGFRAACERLARIHRLAAGRIHGRQPSPAFNVA